MKMLYTMEFRSRRRMDSVISFRWGRVFRCVAVLVSIALVAVWSHRGAALSSEEQAQELMDCASRGDLAGVTTLLRLGVPCNTPDACGNSPLLFAAALGNSEVTELLLGAGADPQHRNYAGGTPLFVAAVNGDTSTIVSLLQHGSDPNIAATGGRTPLMMAVLFNHYEAVAMLLSTGADIEAADELGDSVFNYAMNQADNDEMVRLLLACGADVRHRNVAGETLLHDAARQGLKNATARLLRAGADPDTKDRRGLTPILLAKERDVARQLTIASKRIDFPSVGSVMPESVSSGHLLAPAVD